MDKDYENFVDRMHSFDDVINLTDTQDDEVSTKLPGLDLKLNNNKNINVGKTLTDKIISKNKG